METAAHYPSECSEGYEDEFSPLEYARLHNLSRNYLKADIGSIEIEKLQDLAFEGLSDDSHLPQFDLGPELKIEERVTLSKEAAIILQSTSSEGDAEDVELLTCSLLDSGRFLKKMRIELPLLKSDHAIDCRGFGSREHFDLTTKGVRFPLEIVDEEKGEGLKFPSRLENRGSELMETLKKERLAIGRDTMVYLQGVLNATWSEEYEKAWWNQEQTYKRNTALDGVTPPLTPRPSPTIPYEPSMSDPAFYLPPLSDPVSPTKQELEALEKKIFEQDIPTPLRKSQATKQHDDSSSDTVGHDDFKIGDIYSPLKYLDNILSPLLIDDERVKRDDLKVEELLTPNDRLAAPKLVRFSDIIEEMDLEPMSRDNTPVLDSKFFEDAFRPAYEAVTRQLEQEKLIEADSTARVDVPVMDFSKPDPPWKKFKQTTLPSTIKNLRMSLIRDIAGQISIWPGARQAGIKLKWAPFPHDLAKVALEEKVQMDDMNWMGFVQDPENEVIDSSSLTWKPPGLKILKEDEDDDDDVEQAVFPKGISHDTSYLVKKRKMEMNGRESARTGASLLNDHGTPKFGELEQRKTIARPNDFISTTSKMDPLEQHEPNILGDAFSAAGSVDNFMELRGTKKPKLADSAYFGAKPIVQTSLAQQNVVVQSKQAIQLAIRLSPVAKALPLPAPKFQPVSVKITAIIASNLFKHRALIKHLEKQLPTLNLVERDFSAHNMTTWMPGSVTRSPIVSPLDSEADIVISPSMGIVITTLQKIKQKPLPGQKAKSTIRARLEKVSQRYEKLVVFVSEGNAEEIADGLNENDCLGYSEFLGFACSLETSISVQYVGGGEETLSKWLVSCVIQNLYSGEMDLIAEETHWELFLRRAGLNAFAAQAIILALKAPDGVDAGSPTKAGLFGLTAFVEMGRDQRIARFGDICGRRILERASDMIDTPWGELNV